LITAPPPSSCACAAPARRAVVFGRPIPFDPPGREDRPSQRARLDQALHPNDVGLQSILKEHPQLHPGAIGGLEERVSARRRDVQRLFDDDVKPPTSRGDPMLGVQPGRAADRDEIHRAVIQKLIEV
jgi:hypothetical protein